MQAGDLHPTESGDGREPDPRARARERAMAESQAVAMRQSQERLKRELQTIAVIRKERLAKSKDGMRRRLLAVAAATGMVCVAVGYAVGTKSPAPAQLHILERIEPAPASVAVADAGLQGNSAQSALGANPAPIQEKPVPHVAEQAATQAQQRPASASAAQQPASVPLALPSPLPLPFNTQAVPARQRASAVQAQSQSRLAAESMASLPAAKPTVKPPEDSDFVLSSTRAKAVPEVKAAEAVPAQPGGIAFKVVNVIEGTVIVRQGQSVKQIKVGEKMPDGQTLKSVSVDKGLFETSP